MERSTHRQSFAPGARRAAALAAALLLSCLAWQQAAANDRDDDDDSPAASAGVCDQTTAAAFRSCKINARADQTLAKGVCLNSGNAAARQKCLDQAEEDFGAARDLCDAQRTARQKVCQAIGQAAYNPPIRPADFTTTIDNPWFPLKPGTVFTYKNDQAVVKVEVTHEKIKLMGVTCVVVHDTSVVDGDVEEDTLDYYAQDKSGNVWYFGEDTVQFDNGFPVGVEGSWRAGDNGAKPGIIMFAMPQPGKTYRQEFALGEAEDMAKVVSYGNTVHVPAGTFTNTLKTFEFSPLEPTAKENKYYAKGVGNVLTIDLETGDREELVKVEHH